MYFFTKNSISQTSTDFLQGIFKFNPGAHLKRVKSTDIVERLYRHFTMGFNNLFYQNPKSMIDELMWLVIIEV